MNVIPQTATSQTNFDIIVIGVGSMGAAACYYIARQGHSVLGLEQFDISHEFGSHAGQSRIIRKAYFEDPNYVPLLNRAYENWKSFEEAAGTKLYYRTGLVYFGNPGNALIKGVKTSASLYNVPLEMLDAKLARERFPQFRVPESFDVIVEPDAGFARPEKTIQLYAAEAGKNGAEIHTREKVLQWKKEGTHISVSTTAGVYRCSQLIITAGAWSGMMIPSFASRIRVTRQAVAWVKPRQWDQYAVDHFPCWLLADDTRPGAFYGFPILPAAMFGEPEGLKIAYHYPGNPTDPDQVKREITREELGELVYCLNKYLPGSFESLLSTKICLYGNSPDEHFIIDRLAGYEERVTIACGFSGHGFKFVPVVGEILADLAVKGKTVQPIGFLSADRFG